jgi:hypothetical protein
MHTDFTHDNLKERYSGNWYPPDKGLLGSQIRSGPAGEKKSLLHLPGIELYSSVVRPVA